MLSFSGFGVKVILTSCNEVRTIFFHSISDRVCPRTICSSNIWQNFQIKQSSPRVSFKPFNGSSFCESYGVCFACCCPCVRLAKLQFSGNFSFHTFSSLLKVCMCASFKRCFLFICSFFLRFIYYFCI